MLLLNLFNDRLKKWRVDESSPHYPRGFLSLARLFTWVALSVVTVVGMPLYAASNVALKKTANQSSTFRDSASPCTANLAVDGNLNGNYRGRSLTHTNGNAEAWWQVDLGGLYDIETIILYNRTDCCGERLSNYHVMVSDTPFPANLTSAKSQANWKQHFAEQSPQKNSITVGAVGRYVRVQLAGTNILSLAEVEVISDVALSIAAALKAQKEAEAKEAAALKAQKEAEAKLAAEKKAKEDALAKLAAEKKAKEDALAKLAAEKKAKEDALAKLAAALKAQEEAEAKCAAENGNSTELNLNDIRLVLGSASGRYYNLTEKVKCLKNNNPHNKYFIHGYSTDVPCDGEAQISGYWVWLQPHWYIWDEQVQNQPQEKP